MMVFTCHDCARKDKEIISLLREINRLKQLVVETRVALLFEEMKVRE